MNKKITRALQPSMRMYFVMLILFAAATFFFDGKGDKLAIAEAVVIVILFVYSRISLSRRNKALLGYIESVTYNVDTATRDTLLNFPLPTVIFNIGDGQILWSNDSFLEMTGQREHLFEVSLDDMVPGFSGKWLMEGKNQNPDIVTLGEKKYRVLGNIVRSEHEAGNHGFLATTYWLDVTDDMRLKSEFDATRPVAAVIMLDNYDELLKSVPEKTKSAVLSEIDDKISDWTAGSGGYLCKYDRDRYIFIFEHRHLSRFVDGKFELLDKVHEVTNNSGIRATVSIGVGMDGENFEETVQFAQLAVEMCLSRGGDQVTVKNKYNFEFYGGRSNEAEKRTKVKSRVMAGAIGELISDSSCVYIMGHKMADMDCLGAAVGLCCIARKRGVKARIITNFQKNSAKPLIDRMQALPEYSHTFITADDAMLDSDSRGLLVVVDTNRPEQVESETLLMSFNRIAVIDHHRRAATYISNAALNFHEPYASSASELVSELLSYLVESQDILQQEAEAVMAGIMLDTKNFALRTGGRTFDAAAFLRRAGADTSEVKRLMQSDFNSTVAKYSIIQQAEFFTEGITVASPQGETDKVTAAQAADELLNVRGIEASFVVFLNSGDVNISARSIGNVNVQLILEKLGGGGNKSAAGVQIKGMSREDAVNALKEKIAEYMSDEKS